MRVLAGCGSAQSTVDRADPIKGNGGMPRTETTDVAVTPLDLSIAKGARCLGVSSRLSTNSISRFESHRVSSSGTQKTLFAFDLASCEFGA